MIQKKALIKFCREKVLAKIEQLKEDLKHLDYSGASETKSSAGDKYETSREMMNQEREKINLMISQQLKMLELITNIKLETGNSAQLGSLVETTKGIYFIAISLGLLRVFETDIFAISPVAPIAKLLIGKNEGDFIVFNKERIEIKRVY